jgi:prolipoprotein diacylglyceryltransferase
LNQYLGAVFGYPIPVFALGMDLGVFAGVCIAVRLAMWKGIAPWKALDLALLALLAALAGARLWYVARHWADYLPNPLAVLWIWEGGLALSGAVAAGAVALILVCRARGLPLGHLADAAGIGAAVGEAVGRPGCMPAGCAAGRPVVELGSWLPALPLPDATGAIVARFPSQLLEAALALLLALWLVRLWRARVAPGRVGLSYLAGYCLIRLAAQPLRV